MVYATDTEGVAGSDANLIHFCNGSDLLIHHAQFTRDEYLNGPLQGHGHSTPEMATSVAKKAGVKRLVLFHHDPDRKDSQLEQIQRETELFFKDRNVPTKGFCARQGMVLQI